MIDLTAEALALHVATVLTARTLAADDAPLPWTQDARDYTSSRGTWVDANYALNTGSFVVDLFRGKESVANGGGRFWSLRVRATNGVEAGYVRTHDAESPVAQLGEAVSAQLDNPLRALRRFIAAEVDLL